MQDEYAFRFGGIARLYGQQALERFRSSHVAVVGIGGVGSWAAEALARSGIGAITLFDLDDICISNTNRQIHALTDTVGKLKVEVLADRMRRINPDMQVHACVQFVTPGNLPALFADGFDYVFDATDSVKAKTAMIAYCRRHKIPIITSGGAGGQTDPTLIRIADLSRTTQDPLLAKIRNNLRRLHGYSRNPKRKFAVDAVYSSENLVYDQGDGTVCQSRPNNAGPARLDCASGFGAATHVTACFGMAAVGHILKKLASQASS